MASKEAREILVSDELPEALRRARRTLETIGTLAHIEPGVSMEGQVAFGVQHADLHITWRREEMGDSFDGGATATTRKPLALLGTILTVEATSPASPSAAQSAIDRFEEAYYHYADPNYRPDRLGVLPLSIIGGLVILILLGVFLWRLPAVRRYLPTPPVNKAIEVSPSPSPSPG